MSLEKAKNELDLFYENTAVLITGGNGVRVLEATLRLIQKKFLAVCWKMSGGNFAA
jgi:hypothetical protein